MTMSYKVCIDIGGTFTDCVVSTPAGSSVLFKTPSTPPAFEIGFIESLRLAAKHFGQKLDEFLGATSVIIHGSTVSTNALVESKVARVGLIVNDGFPDILTLREAPRKPSFQLRLDYPPPFVPRNRTVEVRGRINAHGEEVTPLNEQDVRTAIERLRRLDVQAIAVCLLWSIIEPRHENRIREIIRENWSDIPVTLSHELNPVPREYRRAISTAIDASLHPVVTRYVGAIEESLAQCGFTGTLLLANCVGGMMPPAEIKFKPIYSVLSGPTLAPMAAKSLTQERDVVVIDMGGTTFDVSAIRDGSLLVNHDALMGWDLLGIPKVDVRSIGAGGGSIAWVDPGGLLHVGPHSAGAEPGPACYGRGDLPTVTDANVVLGIIDPDNFLGGRIPLNRDRAKRAVDTIATSLRISLVEAAYAIHTTCNHNMVGGIEEITVNEGINPRESYLVCGGGATSCHVSEMVKVLGIPRFMIPKCASALSAFGGLVCDIRSDESATLHVDSRWFALDEVNRHLSMLLNRAKSFLDRAKVPNSDRRYEYTFRGHYEYQSWDIDVPFTAIDGRILEGDAPKLIEAFHDMHERIYTIKSPADPVEILTWTVTARGLQSLNSEPRYHRSNTRSGPFTPKSSRSAYVHEAGGMTEVPVYSGNEWSPGDAIIGPAIVEEDTTTIFVLPGIRLDIDNAGNYLGTVTG